MNSLVVKGTIWFLSEVILSLYGLDDLADYSEFIFESKAIVMTVQYMG